MAERFEVGPMDVVDPAQVPRRVELLQPALWSRIRWVAGALLAAVFVWSVALASGWVDLTGWRIVTRRLPQGSEHLLWLGPGLLAAVCLGMAVSGVRVSIGRRRLALYGLWPDTMARTFDLYELRAADFRLGTTPDGGRCFVAEFAFPDAQVAIALEDRHVWENLRARFTDRSPR